MRFRRVSNGYSSVPSKAQISEGGGFGLIREKQLAATGRDFMKLCCAHDLRQMRDVAAVRQYVAAPGLGPQSRELRVPDENGRASRGVRAVLEIVHAAVQQQRGASGIEKNGRKRIILAVQNQLTGRGIEESIGEQAGPKIRVEFNERQTAGMEKHHHHQSNRHKSAAPLQ